ncbi:MAG TPA: transposase [Pirellulales bacterium]|nr:transposase [Pirellulales bacterium]
MVAPFEYFDLDDDLEITQQHLPHWDQPGKTYFVTFRTADSMPADVLRQWHQRRRDWLSRHHINPDREDWEDRLAQLPERFQRQFHETISREYHRHLDDCHGECVLRQPDLAKSVADSLHFFDAERYRLGDFIVMPNHVHLLVGLVPGIKIKAQCRSWKRYTAGEINKKLGRRGRFWQVESFDHIVRSPDQFERLRRYIASNPQKAGLREGEYLLYRFDGAR